MLNKKVLGLTFGILWALWLLFMTLWVMVSGGGNHLSLLGQFYPGYAITPLGALLGIIYAFIDGFLFGWLVGWFYNKLSKK